MADDHLSGWGHYNKIFMHMTCVHLVSGLGLKHTTQGLFYGACKNESLGGDFVTMFYSLMEKVFRLRS